jgi:serine/threonine protein kinase
MVNEYVLGETIGQGLFGKVKKATRIENGVEKLYAMKILKKQLMAKQKIYYKDEQGGNLRVGFSDEDEGRDGTYGEGDSGL